MNAYTRPFTAFQGLLLGNKEGRKFSFEVQNPNDQIFKKHLHLGRVKDSYNKHIDLIISNK